MTASAQAIRPQLGLSVEHIGADLVWVKRVHGSHSSASSLRHEAQLVHELPGLLGLIPLEPAEQGGAYFYRALSGSGEGDFGNPSAVVQRAIELAQALAPLHRAGLQLRGLEPEQLWWQAGSVAVIDVQQASLFSEDHSLPVPLHRLTGDLHYLAPEQTGRMNARCDHRADYYRLGVMLYRWLTGRFPFEATEPLELLHQHLSTAPLPPSALRPDIPERVSQICLKLLAKQPSARYQSAEGLLHDLRNLHSLQTLGSRDLPYRWDDDYPLHSRPEDCDALRTAFSRSSSGAITGFFLGAPSGMGKTTLIRELYLPAVRANAGFWAGKFNQFGAWQPYSAWLSLLATPLQEAEDAGPEACAQLAAKLKPALGDSSAVLSGSLPALARLLGQEPAPQELSANDARARFLTAVLRFIAAFAYQNQPLIVFLDDLQWADPASLALLQGVLEAQLPLPLLVIAAYRDNEVDAHHPMQLMLQRLRTELPPLALLQRTLSPLRYQDTLQLLARALLQSESALGPLAELLQQHSGGNPFHLWQLLRRLRSTGALAYQPSLGQWRYQADALNLALPDHGLQGLMAERMAELSPFAQQALARAAALGASFGLEPLAAIAGIGRGILAQTVLQVMHAGFVLPAAADVPFEGKRLPSRLRFVHDRMQQAAYASIPAADRSALHLEIGRRLYDHAVEHGGDELDAVSHFNQALVLLQPQERPLVANLNEAAALRAKAAAAFESAAAFARLAVLLMPGAALAWRQDAALARRRYRLLAEISPLAGAMEEGLNTIDDALAVESEPSERAEFQLLRINQFTLAARYADAIAAGQASLLELNAALSKLPVADAEAAEATTQAIARLPQSARMAEGSAELPLRVLLAMGPPCYRSNPPLWQQVVHTELALMLRAGWAPAATYTLPAYAGLTAPWTAAGDAVARHAEHAGVIEQATRAIMSRCLPVEQSIGHLMIGSSLSHWLHPLARASQEYLDGYQVGLASGNLQYAVYCHGHNAYCRYYQGSNRPALVAELRAAYQFCLKRQNRWGVDLTEATLRVLGEAAEPEQALPDESVFEERCQSNGNAQVLCIYRLMRADTLLLQNQTDAAAGALAKAKPDLALVATQGLLPAAQAQVVEAVLLARKPDRSAAESERLRQLQEWLRARALITPSSYQHAALWVEAESQWQRGDPLAAAQSFDRALDAAVHAEHYARAAHLAGRAAALYACIGHQNAAAALQRLQQQQHSRWQLPTTASSPPLLVGSADDHELLRLGPIIAATPDGLGGDGLEADLIRMAALAYPQAQVLLLRRNASDTGWRLWHPYGTQAQLTERTLDAASDLPRAWISSGLERGSLARWLAGDAPAPTGLAPGIQHLELIPLGPEDHCIGGYLCLSSKRPEPQALPALDGPLLRVLRQQAALSLRNAERASHLLQTIATREAHAAAAQKALAAAEAAGRAKVEFLSAVSHEFRTPINGIVGLSELLEQAPYASDAKAKLQRIGQLSHSLLQQVEDIIETTRLESASPSADHDDFTETTFDWADLIRQCAARARVEALGRGLGFQLIEQHQGSPWVRGDAERLEKILRRLLDYCLHFADSGDIVLEAITDERHNQRQLLLKLRNAGLCIAPELRRHLFEPFAQRQAGERLGGISLALALCNGWLATMGGSLSLDESYHGGTQFLLRLTLAKGSTAIAVKSRPKLRGEVLVAEDNPTNAMVVRIQLEKLGLKVRIAANGRLALAAIAEQPPDLLLLDLHMPEMDGYGVLRQLKTREDWAKLPVVVLTADALPEVRQRCMDLGAQGWLTKPVSQAQLAQAIGRWLPPE